MLERLALFSPMPFLFLYAFIPLSLYTRFEDRLPNGTFPVVHVYIHHQLSALVYVYKRREQTHFFQCETNQRRENYAKLQCKQLYRGKALVLENTLNRTYPTLWEYKKEGH